MNVLVNAIIEGFGRKMGEQLYGFVTRSLGIKRGKGSTTNWDTPDDDDDDDDGEDGDDDGDGDVVDAEC